MTYTNLTWVDQADLAERSPTSPTRRPQINKYMKRNDTQTQLSAGRNRLFVRVGGWDEQKPGPIKEHVAESNHGAAEKHCSHFTSLTEL